MDPAHFMLLGPNLPTRGLNDETSCVDRYCELAKVDRKSVKTENRIAKPVADSEPAGGLQPIASRVLVKILFATRMARWDLLRASQSLANRVTKWSRYCDVALHRLVCYIYSSLDCWTCGCKFSSGIALVIVSCGFSATPIGQASSIRNQPLAVPSTS